MCLSPQLKKRVDVLTLKECGYASSPLRIARKGAGLGKDLWESREVAPAQKSHVVAGPGKWRLQERAGLRAAEAARRKPLWPSTVRWTPSEEEWPRGDPPGPALPAGEGSGPPGLDRWVAPPLWPSGRRGAGGVCVSPRWLLGHPLGNGKGAGVRRLRGDRECGQRSAWARASSLSPGSAGLAAALPCWGPLKRLGPHFCSKRKHSLRLVLCGELYYWLSLPFANARPYASCQVGTISAFYGWQIWGLGRWNHLFRVLEQTAWYRVRTGVGWVWASFTIASPAHSA